MLKKGQVYKITYELNTEDSEYLGRDNMIISPAEDVDVRKIFNKQISLVKCLFHINLGNYVCRDMAVGLLGVIKIERPNTQQDFDDIEKAMKNCDLIYNKQWNRIEGYERGMGGMFKTIK